MDELGVVGLDLATGREVSLLDQGDVPRWRRRGLVGDRSLDSLPGQYGLCLAAPEPQPGPGKRQP